MPYIPHTDAERSEMLHAIGVERLEDLFQAVPEHIRFPELDLPEGLSEMEALQELTELSHVNEHVGELACFLGAGAYRHYIPPTVNYVLNRGEFVTAYTPYQPEISQGTLQAIFEYQSQMCALTGMEVSNASHYDGATSLAEGALMAVAVSRGARRKIVVSPAVHPEYRAVVRTYTQGLDMTITGDGAPADVPIGDISGLLALLDRDTAALVVQTPNFFGQLEDLSGLAERVHAAGALLIVVADPISLGLFKPPGMYGADIVCGEGQALGIPLSYGGPYLGYFTTRQAYVRQMAGRLVGETVDAEGRRGYVLTLSTREQHIRREKATSNICTNQGLTAMVAGIYLATMGKGGLRQVAELCYHKAHYAAAQIDRLEGYSVVGDRPFFKEFVVKCPRPVAEINAYLLDEWGIIGGYDLGRDYPHLQDHMLVCVTEMNSREQIDDLVEALQGD
ncbi:MAG: aminomethyl-transferring glycine dehydrogenase subunit GcvPA [Thermoflexales bacterium]|nr:aminomethyl-transferring glycine dehydrogenase subunit GcvPA [Thermoflexales bacterium]